MEEKPGLIAAVAVYDCSTTGNTIIYRDTDDTAYRKDAGTGPYSLIATYENNTVCVLYKNKISYFEYDSSINNYKETTRESYSLDGVFTSSSFVNSIERFGIKPTRTRYEEGKTIIKGTYKIIPLNDQEPTVDEVQALNSYTDAFEQALPGSTLETELRSMITEYKKAWVSDGRNMNDSSSISRVLSSVESQVRAKNFTYGIKGYVTNLDKFLVTVPFPKGKVVSGGFEGQEKERILKVLKEKTGKDMSTVLGKAGIQTDESILIKKFSGVRNVSEKDLNDLDLYNPRLVFVTMNDETTPSYAVYMEMHYRYGATQYSTVNWGEYNLTIHNIRYLKDDDGNNVPRWMQLEYSKPVEEEKPKVAITAQNLREQLQMMEEAAKGNADGDGGAKWLEVTLDVQNVSSTENLFVSEVTEVKGNAQIHEIMLEQKMQIQKDINANAEKYRRKKDTTHFIEAENLSDLESEIQRCIDEVENQESEDSSEEDTAAPEQILGQRNNSISIWNRDPGELADGTVPSEGSSITEGNTEPGQPLLSAMFTLEGTDDCSPIETIADEGPGLLEYFGKIYQSQEKIKKQALYLQSCQLLQVNTYYDQLLTMMDKKFDEYREAQLQEGMSEQIWEERRSALDRIMAKRNLNKDDETSAGNTDTEEIITDKTAQSSEVSAEEAVLGEPPTVGEPLVVIPQDQIKLPESMVGDGLDETLWSELRDKADQDPEGLAEDSEDKNELASYLVSNYEIIDADLEGTIADLKLLAQLAMDASTKAESITQIKSETEGDTENSVEQSQQDIYTYGYEKVLAAYETAKEALNQIVEGMGAIAQDRSSLEDLQTEEIQINRYDLELSDAKKESLLAECDRMEKLLKTILAGATDGERVEAMKEFESTAWNIDVNYQKIGSSLTVTTYKTKTISHYDVIWSATVTKCLESQNDYMFTDGLFNLRFEGDTIEFTPELESILGNKTLWWNWNRRNVIASYLNRLKGFGSQGDRLENMDQAVHAVVNHKSNGADAQTELVLLSQAEGRSSDTVTNAKPDWNLFSISMNLVNGNSSNYKIWSGAKQQNDAVSYTKTVTNYSKIYSDTDKMSVEQAKNNADAMENPETTSYEVKLRGMLGERNTIFLDNPKLRTEELRDRMYYFFNISLDEGVQLYALDVKNNKIIRQKEFEGIFADLFQKGDSGNKFGYFTQGAYFQGWWIPDGKTPYNSDGNLSGGDLVLLGLSKEDLKKYSSDDDKTILDEAGNEVKQLRPLVNDDLFHSKLYKIHITSEQMNDCKLTETTTKTDKTVVTGLTALMDIGGVPYNAVYDDGGNNYQMIPGNLVQGTKSDRTIYFRMLRESGSGAEKRGISDIYIVSSKERNKNMPAGYVLIDQDLNEGTGKGTNYIYMGYKTGGTPIRDLKVISGDSSDIQPEAGWTRINQDLNEGAGGAYVYLCYKK